MEGMITAVNNMFIEAETEWRTNRIMRIICIFCTVAMMVALCLCTAFADPETTTSSISSGITGGAEQLFNIMEAVVVPIAAVCFAWNAFKVFFGGERGMEQAKRNILIIVIVLALVFLAPLIIKEVSKWFNGGKGTWNVIAP